MGFAPVFCAAGDLPALFAAISERMPLYLPAESAPGIAAFRLYEEGVAYCDAIRGVKSPKELFFPQNEDIARFTVGGEGLSVEEAPRAREDFAVFGVRACDLRALEALDRVFLDEPRDSLYAARRAHGILLTMACERPARSCFCRTFGIDPAVPAGDVSCIRLAGGFLLEPRTDRGAALLGGIAVLSPAGEEVLAARESARESIRSRYAALPLADLSTDGFGAGMTERYFDSPAWEKFSSSCLGCGSCTFACPTCQCYDIRDFEGGQGVLRYRCWDSCMYSDFTLMSAGQPRTTQKERFRQRFLHKLVYFPERYGGMFSCVGCGRCLQKCPQSLHIVKVMRALREVEKAGSPAPGEPNSGAALSPAPGSRAGGAPPAPPADIPQEGGGRDV